jgi:hypothetical protein
MMDVSMVSPGSKLTQEPAALHRITEIWSIAREGRNPDTLLKLFLERVQNAHAARSVWEALRLEERTCLFHVLKSRNAAKQKGVTVESLRRHLKCSQGDIEGVVNRLVHEWHLVEMGLMETTSPKRRESASVQGVFPFRECFPQLWRTGQELFHADAAGNTPTLADLLAPWEEKQLHHLASLCHVPTSPRGFVPSYSRVLDFHRQEDLHDRLCEALHHPLVPFDLLHRLETSVQEVFIWLCEQEGKVRPAQVRASLPSWNAEQLLSLLGALEAHALAFDRFLAGGERWLFIPQDVFLSVRRDAGQQAEDEKQLAFLPLSEGAPNQELVAPLLLYDMAVVVGESLQNNLEPTKDDRLPKRWREKIRPLVQGATRLDELGNDLFVDQLFHAARELKLLTCRAPIGEEKRRYFPGDELVAWSERTLMGQAQLFLQWWVRVGSSWKDLLLEGRLVSSLPARQTLVEALKRCVPGRFYRLDALLYAIWRQKPLPLYDYYHRRLIKPTSLRSLRDQWMEREGPTYVGMLTSTLTEMGIVSVFQHGRNGQEKQHEVFCVTPFGGTLLAHEDDQPLSSSSDPQKPLLIVQPNYDVVVLEFLPSLIYRLLSFAQVQRIGMVSEFRLVQRCLLRGLARGATVEQVMALLAEQSGKMTLPQNVAYTLRDWTREYREASLEEIILVKITPEENEQALFRALAHLDIEPRKLAPGIFAVSAGKTIFVELYRHLEKEGIVVRAERTNHG